MPVQIVILIYRTNSKNNNENKFFKFYMETGHQQLGHTILIQHP